MGVEIERKFLLADESWRSGADEGVPVRQGYFLRADSDAPTVRIRIAGTRAFLTVKGRADGIARSEFEYPVPNDDAEAMLREFCGTRVVEKRRFRVPFGGFVWEVDEYFGANAPLVTAEIELPDEKTVVELPGWIDHEVTDDHRYKNNNLAEHPFSEWYERKERNEEHTC